MKKVLLKISQKSQKKHLFRGLFLIKIPAGGLYLYYKEALVLVFFCKFCEIFKSTYLGNVCERLLLRVRSLRVSFRKV